MDTAYTYQDAAGAIAYIYAPPEYLAPERLVLGSAETRQSVTFYRLSDRSLDCEPVSNVKGRCDRFECHRREPGKCQCGRHPDGTRIERARTN